MSEISQEKLIQIVAAAEKMVRCKGRYHSEQNYRALAALFGVTTPDLPPLESDLMRERAEPVAWTDEQELRDVNERGCGYLFTVNPITPHADPRRVIKLYAEQPAPVVPDERAAFNEWNNDTDCPLAGLTVKQAAWLAWLKRSGTMSFGNSEQAEPVSPAYKLPEG